MHQYASSHCKSECSDQMASINITWARLVGIRACVVFPSGPGSKILKQPSKKSNECHASLILPAEHHMQESANDMSWETTVLHMYMHSKDTQINTCVYIYIYICIHIAHMYMYIYIYIYTYRVDYSILLIRSMILCVCMFRSYSELPRPKGRWLFEVNACKGPPSPIEVIEPIFMIAVSLPWGKKHKNCKSTWFDIIQNT